MPRELRSSGPYFERATITGFSLINSPGVATFHPSFQGYRPSVLDLAFANQAFLSLHPQWDNNLPPTGSDHTAPSTTIRRIDANPSLPSPNWDAIDWDMPDLATKEISLPPRPQSPPKWEPGSPPPTVTARLHPKPTQPQASPPNGPSAQ